MQEREPRKVPTLKDVAARANVDPSVVSRFINNDERLSISDATRARVLAAISEVGYRPNVAAKALKLGRTFLVGLLVPDFANPVYAEIIRGAREAADEAGYALVLGSASDRSGGEGWYHRLVDERRVDGLLFASAELADPRLAEIAASDSRILIVNRLVPGVDAAVVVDDVAGSRLATKHLIDLGHRRIASVAGPPGVETTERRCRGFLDEATSASIESPILAMAESVSAESGYQAARSLLDQNPGITGIYASTLVIGFGVLKAVLASGRSVPRDVSVIALNDSELAQYVNPALTTVAMPYREMGRTGLKQLLSRIDGAPSDGEIVITDPPPRLVQRDSTGPPQNSPNP